MLIEFRKAEGERLVELGLDVNDVKTRWRHRVWECGLD